MTSKFDMDHADIRPEVLRTVREFSDQNFPGRVMLECIQMAEDKHGDVKPLEACALRHLFCYY